MLVLDGAAYAAIGLEVNADHLAVVAIDLAGDRLLSWRRAFAGRRTPAARRSPRSPRWPAGPWPRSRPRTARCSG